jgi:hypothetical protein
LPPPAADILDTNRIRRSPRDFFKAHGGRKREDGDRQMTADHDSKTRQPQPPEDGPGPCDTERQSMRVSRWTSLLYLVVALAAPVLVYSGPDVLSPSAEVIADAALVGHFGVARLPRCAARNAAGERQAPARKGC